MSFGLPIEQQLVDDTSGPDIGTFEASYDLAMMDTFVSNVARTGIESLGIPGALDELSKTTTKVLSPEEANKLYQNVETPFSQPVNEAVAFQLNEEGAKRKLLQQKIAENPGGTFYKGAVNFGAGILAHALDPVEFGVGAFAGMGLQSIGAVAATGRFGAGAVGAGKMLAKGGLGKEVVEGVLGNAALEPYMYASSKEAQLDYGMEDAFISVVGGGIAAPLAIHGLKSGYAQLSKISPSTFGLAKKVSVGQFFDAKMPNVEAVKTSFDEFLYGNPPKGIEVGQTRSQYVFETPDINTFKSKPVYASPIQHGDINSGSRVIGDYQGDGFYLTDNPNFANNAAANPLEEMTSNVHEFNVNELNLKDADIPDKQFIDSLPVTEDIKKVIGPAESIKQAQDLIRAAIDDNKLDDGHFTSFMDSIKNSGVDGIRFTDEAKGHNPLFVFNDSVQKMSETNKFDADPKAVPQLDSNKLEQVKKQIQESKFDHDRTAQKEFDDFIPKEDAPLKEKELFVDDAIKTLDDMEKLGLLTDKEDLATLKQIKESKKITKDLIEAVKDFATCKLSGAD